VVDEAGVDLLHPGEEAPLVGRKLVPGLDAGVPRRQLRPRRHDAEVDLPGQPGLADGVPAVVEPATVLLDVRLRDLVRPVGGAKCQVEEERTLGSDRLLVADEADRPVDQVLAQVVALTPLGRR
jgi:hypothetical protein